MEYTREEYKGIGDLLYGIKKSEQALTERGYIVTNSFKMDSLFPAELVFTVTYGTTPVMSFIDFDIIRNTKEMEGFFEQIKRLLGTSPVEMERERLLARLNELKNVL